MKRCQVCQFLSDENAPTCPKCGEASWAPCPPVPGMKGAVLILDEQAPVVVKPATADHVAHSQPRHDDRRNRR